MSIYMVPKPIRIKKNQTHWEEGDAVTGMSLDFLIACVIRESESKNEPIWFNRLEKVLDGIASRATISKNIDKLFDYGIISGEWCRNAEGNWARVFRISGEASTLVAKVAEQYKDNPELRTAYSRMGA